MEIETANGVQVTEALTALRQELSRLGERVAALEAAVAAPAPVERRGVVDLARETQAAPAETLSEELIAVLSAAIAAYLGKKPHIRQIRLIGTTTWAEQGRVTIEASHALAIRRARS
jgi:methylmalonyl-CoA carboxyltransferase large subunit